MLTAAEPGRRNRRTIDVVLLAAGALFTGLAGVVAASAPDTDEDVAEALTTVLGWAGPLWRAAFLGALVLALVIAVAVLLRRRWALARDVVVALLVVVGVGILLGRLVESDWLVIEADVWSRWGFPELRVACVTAAVAVAGPELVRPVRVFAAWLVALAALGAVVLDAALPSGVLGALAFGLGAAALVRAAFGTAAGFPPAEDVRLALTWLGVNAVDLRPAVRQRIGSAEYVGHDVPGLPLRARVLGRDAQDTQRLARRWRSLAYRDPPRSVADGRLEQVEHEALATLMAAQAGVTVPQVLTAALGPGGDALIVTRQPDVEPLESALPEQVGDETLRQLWDQVARLHASGISHGRLNTANVIVVDAAPVLVDLSAATLGAPQSALDIDVAELLVACTVLVGPDRALRAAVEGVGVDAVAGALPYLQRAALTPHVRDLARHHEVALDDLRAAAATAAGQEKPPEIAPLRRIRPEDLLLTAALIFAAYLLITQFAEIGFDTIADEVGKADPAWVVVALILAQSTFIPSGISVRGGVPTPLALLPCVVLQSAIKFINLTVPSSAGRIAMNLRFLQRMGAPRAEAVAAGAVDDVSNTIVQAALFLLTLPLVQVDFDTSQFSRLGARHSSCPGDRRRARRQRNRGSGRAEVARQGRAGRAQLPVQPLERGPHSAQATGALRRDHCGRAALCTRAGCDLSCLRRRPQPGAARPHQHRGLRPFEPHTGARRYRGRRGQPLRRPHRRGRRRVHGLCNRHHPATLHLLPPSHLGIRVAALAQSQGIPLAKSGGCARRAAHGFVTIAESPAST